MADREETVLHMHQENTHNDPAKVLDGWKTVRKLGEGSFGAVYEIERKVGNFTEKAALKVMTIPSSNSEVESLREMGYSEEGLSRHYSSCYNSVVKEYSAVKQIKDCVNIVSSEDLITKPHDGNFGWDIYIRMELLSPMIHWLNRKYGENGQISDEDVITCGTDICKALSACARKHIIHRDIKPQNTLVSDEGVFKLGDFGTARKMESSFGMTEGIGTRNYMAPEVAFSKEYDYRADIYSLGMVLYWMLNSRRLPFLPLPPKFPSYTDSQEALHRRLSGEKLPEPCSGSAALKAVVLKACSFAPEDRFSSADGFAEALRNAKEGSTILLDPREKEYEACVRELKRASSAESLSELSERFLLLGEYKSSAKLADICLKRLDALRGQNIPWRCSCGALNAANSSFCSSCGKPRSGEKAPKYIFHKVVHYGFLPLWIITSLITLFLAQSIDQISLCLIYLILPLITFIGFFKFRKYSWYTMIARCSIGTLASTIDSLRTYALSAHTSSDVGTAIGSLLGTTVLCVAFIAYYVKIRDKFGINKK